MLFRSLVRRARARAAARAARSGGNVSCRARDGGQGRQPIGRHLAAIGWKHRQVGLVAPVQRDERMVIADTLAETRREQRTRPSARKAALTAKELAAMIAAADGEGTRSIRDRAILALGLAAALRRSELVALEWRDVELVDKGLKLTLRHSKTDQDGEGQVIAVPSGKILKPVERLKAWLAVRGGSAGPLFYQIDPQGRVVEAAMSDRSVARLIQRYAAKVGSIRRALGGIRSGPGSSPKLRVRARPWRRCRKCLATRRSRSCLVMSVRRNCLTTTRGRGSCDCSRIWSDGQAGHARLIRVKPEAKSQDGPKERLCWDMPKSETTPV